jgi:PAT family beta-lactamase induction signal transducer AmpG
MQTRKPSIYIPTLYFAEGLPYTVVMIMSGVFFKTLGADNTFVGLTTLLYWPWVLKFAWSPFVDLYSTKRGWIVVAQISLSIILGVLGAVAFLTGGGSFGAIVTAASIVLTLCAFASATQDIAIDGYYLDVLDDEQKAFFVGVRNTFYKVAWMFGSGGMVFLAGKIAESHGIGTGWGVAFAVCALAMLGCGMFHAWYLPTTPKKTVLELAQDRSSEQGHGVVDVSMGKEFLRAIGTYFKQPAIIPIVFYILSFRFGDALMLKQAPNFLLDPASKGGLGIALADMGIISGTVGVIALLCGGIVGSWLISKHGLKKCMWPFALIQNGAILLYWLLAAFPQQLAVTAGGINSHLPAVYVINSVEQFTYGLGVAAYTVFLMTTVKNEYKAAHYATATALMALGMMTPGVASGYLYQMLGYANFFLVSFFTSLPGIFAIFFLPIWHETRPIAVGESKGEHLGVSQTRQVGSESK